MEDEDLQKNKEYICKYCRKKCKSKLSKSCHERVCKLNPNKIDTFCKRKI